MPIKVNHSKSRPCPELRTSPISEQTPIVFPSLFWGTQILQRSTHSKSRIQYFCDLSLNYQCCKSPKNSPDLRVFEKTQNLSYGGGSLNLRRWYISALPRYCLSRQVMGIWPGLESELHAQSTATLVPEYATIIVWDDAVPPPHEYSLNLSCLLMSFVMREPPGNDAF